MPKDFGTWISDRGAVWPLKSGRLSREAAGIIRNPKSTFRNRRRAFTLIEAVAAVALVGIGITASLSGLSVIAKTDRLLLEREKMQRMAVRKYEEIVATGQIETADLSGDFTDQNIGDYEWTATVEPSGEENLEILTVVVNKAGAGEEDPQATVDGLVFNPPIQGGAAQ